MVPSPAAAVALPRLEVPGDTCYGQNRLLYKPVVVGVVVVIVVVVGAVFFSIAAPLCVMSSGLCKSISWKRGKNRLFYYLGPVRTR